MLVTIYDRHMLVIPRDHYRETKRLREISDCSTIENGLCVINICVVK